VALLALNTRVMQHHRAEISATFNSGPVLSGSRIGLAHNTQRETPGNLSSGCNPPATLGPNTAVNV